MNKTPKIVRGCLIAISVVVLFCVSQAVYILAMIGREGPIYHYYKSRDWHDDITQLFSRNGVKVQALSCTTFDRSRDCDCVFHASTDQIAASAPCAIENNKQIAAQDKSPEDFDLHRLTTRRTDSELARRYPNDAGIMAYGYHHGIADPGGMHGGLPVTHHYRIVDMVIYYQRSTQDASVSVFHAGTVSIN